VDVDYVFVSGRCVYARPGADPYREMSQ